MITVVQTLTLIIFLSMGTYADGGKLQYYLMFFFQHKSVQLNSFFNVLKTFLSKDRLLFW